MNQSAEAVSDGYRAVHALDISWLHEHQLIRGGSETVVAGTCAVVLDDLWLYRARVRSAGGSCLRY